MKTACVEPAPVAYSSVASVAGASGSSLPQARSRWLDFLELTKPRIGVMVLFTVAIGALLTPPADLDVMQLLHALIGTALVASGASALNQWLERRTDARMRRTENRPLPACRLSVAEVVAFGFGLSGAGLAYMASVMTHPLSAILTGVTLVTYVFVYTPLKSKTTLNTLIGAAPGALPPVIGWTAMTGTLDPIALVLFGIVYFWQVPHFLAIAWMHREDYARAGLKMLPSVDVEGSATSRQMLLYALALVPISLLPVLVQGSSVMYAFGALGIGVFFVQSVWMFAAAPSQGSARRVLHASLIYLPSVFGLLLLESVIRFVLS